MDFYPKGQQSYSNLLARMLAWASRLLQLTVPLTATCTYRKVSENTFSVRCGCHVSDTFRKKTFSEVLFAKMFCLFLMMLGFGGADLRFVGSTLPEGYSFGAAYIRQQTMRTSLKDKSLVEETLNAAIFCSVLSMQVRTLAMAVIIEVSIWSFSAT